MARLVAILLVGSLLMVGCSGLYGTPAAAPTAKPATSPQPAGAAPGATSAAGQVEVTIQGFAFNPKTVTVAPGITVRWTNKDSAAHTVTSDKGTFDSGSLSQDKSFSFKLTQAGTYEYHCSFHANMTANIVVR